MTFGGAEAGARAWMARLRQESGGFEIPSFIAHRLAAVAAVEDMDYIDVYVPEQPGGRVDVKVIALSEQLMIGVLASQVAPGPRPPEHDDATTEVVVRSIQDVVGLRIAGRDTDWTSGSVREVAIREGSLIVQLRNGSVMALPQSWRAEGAAPAAIKIIVEALSRSSGSSVGDVFSTSGRNGATIHEP